MAIPGKAETLERLLIEIVGDDSSLKASLEAAVKAAQDAAERIRAALAIDFTAVTQGAAAAAAAVEQTAAAATTAAMGFDVFEAQLKTGGRIFDDMRAAGRETTEQFEEYRRGIIEMMDAQRPLLTQLGYTGAAFDELYRHVTEATYSQAEQSKQDERNQKTQDALAETIKRLSNEVKGSRNAWAGRIASDEEFTQSTIASRAALIGLLGTVEKGSDAYRKITQDIAYAQRGLDSANQVASRGGLAWTTQIALTNQFGDSLRRMGPAGAAAAGGLGIVGGAAKAMRTPITAATLDVNALTAASSRLALVIAPLAVAVAAVGAGGLLAKLTLDSSKWAADLDTVAANLGATTEGLQELRHAATATGTSTTALESSLDRLQRRAADAAAGSRERAAAFERLGVSVTTATGNLKSSEQLLEDVADGLAKVGSSTVRAKLAFDLFGREQKELTALLAEGGDGIRALRREARDLGLVVSGESVLSLAQFDAKLKTVHGQLSTVKTEITAAFLPVFTRGLIPMLQDHLVPWIQNAADQLAGFADTLFDSSEQGDQLRERIAQLLTPMGRLAMGALAFGRAVYLGMQTIGAAIQTLMLNTQIAWEDFKASFGNMKLPTTWQEALGFPGMTPEPQSGGRGNLRDELRARRDELLLAYADNIDAAAQPLLDAIAAVFNDDVPAAIKVALGNLVRPGGTAARDLRKTGGDLGDLLGGGTRTALEGSLKYAQEQAQKALEEFNYAVGNDARTAAWAVVQNWQAAIKAIEDAFKAADPAAAAKAWTGRLAAELALGVKTSAEVMELLTPTFERLQAEAAAALAEFGIDSAQYKDVAAKLEAVDALLKQVRGNARPLELAPTAAISDAAVTQAIAYETALKEQEKQAAVTARAFDRLGEMGVSLADRMAFLKDSTWADALMVGPDVGDAITLAVKPVAVLNTQVDNLKATIKAMLAAGAEEPDVLAHIERLTQLVPMSVKDLNDLTGGWYRNRNAVIEYTQAAADAFNEAPAVQAVIATLDARLTPALAAAREQATALGQSFDFVAAKQTALQGIINELGGKAALTAGELAVYRQAIAELADLNATVATANVDKLFAAWKDGVNQLGVTLSPLAAASVALSKLGLTSEQLKEALELLAAAGARLDQTDFDATLKSWSETVARIGVTADPIRDARAELDRLFAGKTDLEEYRLAVEALTAAQERLAKASGDAAAKTVRDAWKTASKEIGDFLRVPQTDLSDLREAAEAAFAAGVISVDEFKRALDGINAMTTISNLRILASQLDATAAIVPNLIADLGQAYAMFAAGNKTDALAVGFQAATTAVEGLKVAFSDSSKAGEAAFDLVLGAASTLATAIGGPAMGQAVAAFGQFLKSVLGDLSNGLAEVQKQVQQTITGSRYLGEDIIQGIAAANTTLVSRGGLLGLLGFTKAELDKAGFEAGVAIAQNLADGLVSTLRSGDFMTSWNDLVDDIIINGLIDQLMASEGVQQALAEAYQSIAVGYTVGARRALEGIRREFEDLHEEIKDMLWVPLDLSSELGSAITAGLGASTVEEAWAITTRKMRDVLRDQIIKAFVEGSVMQRFFAPFSNYLDHALEDGILSPEELAQLEGIFANAEGPLQELWRALQELGLGFDNLNDAVTDVTASLSNVPQVFKITQATMDAIGARSGTQDLNRFPLGIPTDPTDRSININFSGPVYGLEDFNDRVSEAVAVGNRRAGLAAFGTTGGR